MSSATAMTKHKGGVAEYRASEGKTVEVPYRYSHKLPLRIYKKIGFFCLLLVIVVTGNPIICDIVN